MARLSKQCEQSIRISEFIPLYFAGNETRPGVTRLEMFVRYRTNVSAPVKHTFNRSILGRMDRTVREHLQELEQRLLSLNARIMEENDDRARNELQTELRAVESALALYRSALEIESRITKAK